MLIGRWTFPRLGAFGPNVVRTSVKPSASLVSNYHVDWSVDLPRLGAFGPKCCANIGVCNLRRLSPLRHEANMAGLLAVPETALREAEALEEEVAATRRGALEVGMCNRL